MMPLDAVDCKPCWTQRRAITGVDFDEPPGLAPESLVSLDAVSFRTPLSRLVRI